MNVLLTLVTSTSALSGVQRHALNLAACLLEHPEISGVHVAISPWQDELLASSGLKSGRLHVHVADIGRSIVSRNAWFYIGLPQLASKIGADLVHASYPVPIRRSAFDVPLVVTLHDLYPFELPANFGRLKAAMHRVVVRECLVQADAITCVSYATYQIVKSFFPIPLAAKSSVVYNCVGRISADPFAPPALLGRGPFLLTVAQHRRNKNIPLALRILKRLIDTGEMPESASLAIVGMHGPETPKLHSLITSLGLTDRVLLLEGISDAELKWCYRQCEAMIVPSTTEGFCLPVAEALLTGCRIICSDIPVLREIAGDRCVFVPLNKDSDANFATALSELLRLPRPAPADLPQFSTRAVGQQYVALYTALRNQHPVRRAAPLVSTDSIPDSGRAQI